MGCVIITAGCQEQESIETYRVPKQHVVERLNHVESASQKAAQAAARPERTLAAIALHDTQGWFFKLSGPPQSVSRHKDEFQAFIKSLRFDAKGPKWELPDGWQERAGVGMRHATMQIDDDDHPLELSVITLPRGEGDEAEYLLANINRWRGQLSLDPIAMNELPAESQVLDLPDGKVTLVDLEGMSSGGTMGAAPFAGGGPFSGAGGGPMSAAGGEQEPAATTTPIEYEAPAEWTATRAGGMRKAAFEVKEGEQRIEITAIDLEKAAGDLLDNVNRWRGQVKLEEIDQQQLDKDLQPIKVDGIDGHYVELLGPGDGDDSQAILGAIVLTKDKAWFFKLTGPAPLAQREQTRFKAFVESVKFK